MSVSPVSAATGLAASDSAPSGPSAVDTARAASVQSPAVINNVDWISSIGGQIASSPSIQSSVSGINALIANFNGIVWSRTNSTPEQIAASKLYEQKLAQAAEGATIAFAGQEGVTGVSFDFGSIDLGSSPPLATSDARSNSKNPPPSASIPSVFNNIPSGNTNSTANIALSLLIESSKPLRITV